MGSGGPGHREDEVLKSRLFIAEDPMACREDIKPLSLVRPIVIYDFCPEVRLRKGYVLILYRVSWSVCAHRGTESARGLHFSEAPAECQSDITHPAANPSFEFSLDRAGLRLEGKSASHPQSTSRDSIK